MARRNNLEKIRGTHMGRGSQDGNLVPGSVENTPPPHSSDGRRRYPNAPCPCTESKEGASICEEYHTRLPEHGGLEAHSDRVPARRHRGLVYFPELHPMAGATDDQSYTVIGSGGVGKKPHIRTSYPITNGRFGGNQGTSERGNSNIVATGNSRGRTMGGGTIPTGTYTSTPRTSTGMGPIKPPSSGSTDTSVRENDSRLAHIPPAARPEMQLPMPFDGHLSWMRITEVRHANVQCFL